MDQDCAAVCNSRIAVVVVVAAAASCWGLGAEASNWVAVVGADE